MADSEEHFADRLLSRPSQVRRLFASLTAIALKAVTGYGFSPYFMFETAGHDCYADGSPLLAGERYALVWRSNDTLGQTDGLFLADGRPVDANRCEVLWLFDAAERRTEEGTGIVYAAAKRSYILVAESYIKEKGDTGVYSLFVFDTRVWNGSEWGLCGKSSYNTVEVLNGYGLVSDLEVINTSKTGTDPGCFVYTRPGDGFLTDDTKVSYGDKTVQFSQSSVASIDPPNVPQPVISGLTADAGVLTLTVTNTAKYLTYGLSMTNDLEKVTSTTNYVGDVKQGVGAGPLTWTVPVGDQPAGFFQLRRVFGFGN